MTTELSKTLASKSPQEIEEYLNLHFGYNSPEPTSKESLLIIADRLQKNKDAMNEDRFIPFQHLSPYIELTERTLSNAFYTSVQSFMAFDIIDPEMSVERQKEIYHEVRDIVVSNGLKVMKPQDLPKEETPRKMKPAAKKATPTTPAPAKKKSSGKGAKVEEIIRQLMADGNDITTIKSRMVMDKYSEVHNDSVSDGYAYDIIVKIKKQEKGA